MDCLSLRTEIAFQRLEVKIERHSARVDRWAMYLISLVVGTVSRVLNNLKVFQLMQSRLCCSSHITKVMIDAGRRSWGL